MNRFTLELALLDSHTGKRSVVCRNVDDVFFDMQMGQISPPDRFDPMGSFEKTVKVIKRREFRRSLLQDLCNNLGYNLAVYLEDKEGWHGESRKEGIERKEVATGKGE